MTDESAVEVKVCRRCRFDERGKLTRDETIQTCWLCDLCVTFLQLIYDQQREKE